MSIISENQISQTISKKEAKGLGKAVKVDVVSENIVPDRVPNKAVIGIEREKNVLVAEKRNFT